MTTVSHIITGLAIATVAIRVNPEFENFGLFWIFFLSVIFSNLPDVNTIWHKNIKTHHKDFTHYPIFLILFTIFVASIEYTILDGKLFFSSLLGFSLLLHIFMDTFGMTIGIHWLWPFTNKEYSFTKLDKKIVIDKDFRSLLRSFTGEYGKIEIVWCLIMFLIMITHMI